MDGIKKLVADPAWWFTAVIIGLLASLAASYIRDAISYVASRYSAWARDRRARRLARLSYETQLLINFPTLLVAELLRCMYLATLFTTILIAATLCNVMAVIRRPDLVYVIPFTFVDWPLNFGVLFGDVLAMFFGNRMIAGLRPAWAALREYRKRCKTQWTAKLQADAADAPEVNTPERH
jgi:hypothetical protein